MFDIRGKEIKIGQLVAYCMYGNNKSTIGLGRVIGFTKEFVIIKEDNNQYNNSYHKMSDLKKKPNSIVIIE